MHEAVIKEQFEFQFDSNTFLDDDNDMIEYDAFLIRNGMNGEL